MAIRPTISKFLFLSTMDNYDRIQRNMQTRLERKTMKQGTRTIIMFLVGSIILLGLFFYFGIPALFGLAGTISGIGSKPEEVQEEEIVLNTPILDREFEATKSAEINIKGTADPGSKVELSRNTISVGLETAGKDGSFVFEDIALEKGRNEFVARTVSNKGNSSDPSGLYVVFFSTSGPKLELNNKDGDSVKESPYTFGGKVDPIDATVMVNERLAIVDGGGNFSYYMTLNDGDNKITVVATDMAGNETKQEINLKYEP